jgi:hypothetical protein
MVELVVLTLSPDRRTEVVHDGTTAIADGNKRIHAIDRRRRLLISPRWDAMKPRPHTPLSVRIAVTRPAGPGSSSGRRVAATRR